MKNVYIHIGFPKTATTTLQHNVLNVLDGTHANKKTCYVFNEPSEFLKLLATGRNSYETFLNQYLNNTIDTKIIISDEFLTIPLISRRIIDSYDTFEIVSKLSTFIKNKKVSGNIILGIRNHPTLLYSLFVESYDVIKHNYKIHNLNEFLLNKGKFDRNRFYELNYYKIVKKLIEIVGKKNVHVILFEDLKHDKDNYYKQMSEAFDIEFNTFKTLFERTHENNKDKVKYGYIYSSKKNRKAIAFIVKISNFPILNLFKVVIRKTKLNEYKLKLLNKLKKTRKILVPYLSEDVNQQIFEAFKESNRKLCELMDLDADKMKKYGYFD